MRALPPPLDHWGPHHRGVPEQPTGAALPQLLETPLSTLEKAASASLALAILAWTPAHSMQRTALGSPAEHIVARLCTATIVGLASRATALLAPQFLLPSMPPSWHAASPMPWPVKPLHDFAFSVGGVLIGSALVCMAPMLVEARKSPGTLIARNAPRPNQPPWETCSLAGEPPPEADQLQPDIRWLSSPSGSDKTKPDKNSRVPCLDH